MNKMRIQDLRFMYSWRWHHVLRQVVNDIAKDQSACAFSVKQSKETSTPGTACPWRQRHAQLLTKQHTVTAQEHQYTANTNVYVMHLYLHCIKYLTPLLSMCSACWGEGQKYNLMTAGNFLKLSKHFNESKCELTVLIKEEKCVNQSGHTQTHFNSWKAWRNYLQ
jgi:hypothetical protein